jgi:hypothetical protein
MHSLRVLALIILVSLGAPLLVVLAVRPRRRRDSALIVVHLVLGVAFLLVGTVDFARTTNVQPVFFILFGLSQLYMGRWRWREQRASSVDAPEA